MGSHANSVHIKCGNSQRVIDCVAQCLADSGYLPTTKRIRIPALGGTSKNRAINISQASGGWVSLLDSDLLGSLELVAAISKSLDVPALCALVSGSDMWAYLLYEKGALIDEFTSSGEALFPSSPANRRQANLSPQKVARMQELLQLFTPEIQQRQREIVEEEQNKRGPPPKYAFDPDKQDVAEAQKEWQREAKEWSARSEEAMKRALERMYTEIPLLREMRELRGADVPVEDAAKDDQPRDYSKHVERLSRFKPASFGDERHLEILQIQAGFAEETLEEFFRAMEIPAHYAYLAYQYLEETHDEELATFGIAWAAHLKFKRK